MARYRRYEGFVKPVPLQCHSKEKAPAETGPEVEEHSSGLPTRLYPRGCPSGFGLGGGLGSHGGGASDGMPYGGQRNGRGLMLRAPVRACARLIRSELAAGAASCRARPQDKSG